MDRDQSGWGAFLSIRSPTPSPKNTHLLSERAPNAVRLQAQALSSEWLHGAQVEAELTELDKEEAEEYLTSLGATEGGLKSLISATYKQLGLLTYFTTGALSCP